MSALPKRCISVTAPHCALTRSTPVRAANTSSTRFRANSAMRRARKLRQKPRFLQENARSRSAWHCSHTTRREAVAEHAAAQERLELLAHVRGRAFGLAPQDPGWRGTATAVGPNHRASHKSRDGYSKPFAKISPLLPSIFTMNTSEPPLNVMSGPTSVWNVAAVEEVVPTT